MKYSSLLIIAVFVFLGCSKKEVVPAPSISFSYTVKENGVVSFFSTGANVKEYYWDFGNGNMSPSPNPTIQYGKNGVYKVSLKAKGDGGEAFSNDQVTVSNVPGSIVFWMSEMKSGKNVQVSINGVVMGTITGYYPSGTPTCGAAGSVTVNALQSRTYTYEAKEIGQLFPATWSGIVTIKSGECSTFRLFYN